METVSRETSLDPWFVTGLVEGAGSFTFSRRPGGKLDLYFAIKVSAADRGLLDAVQAYLGVGRVYEIRRRGTDGSPQVRALYYRVHRRADHEAIVSHFERFPLHGVTRREQYLAWRRIWELLMYPAWQIDWTAVSNAADALSERTAGA